MHFEHHYSRFHNDGKSQSFGKIHFNVLIAKGLMSKLIIKICPSIGHQKINEKNHARAATGNW